jgi:hypothetical protein
MRRRIAYKIAFLGMTIGAFLCPLMLLLLPENAGGTNQYMVQLPTYLKYRCANCHISAEPTLESHDLNLFGKDFKANEFLWNRALAEKNSDMDRCTNGFELGDQNGDGLVDQASTIMEQSNPGDPNDCSIALSESTWGIIKNLFSGGN